MNEKRIKNISKFLSLILRHSPETIGLQLDSQGWASIQELMSKAAGKGQRFTVDELLIVVAENDKQRFALSEDNTRIRANQGHSVKIALDLEAVAPPEYLYHGTVGKFMPAIRKEGLLKMSRHHVHLSEKRDTAVAVGSRRGLPVILTVHSGRMFRDGMPFFCSANNVWLTDHVPVKYIEF
ncbi:RNA 2'-phosphotransferase [Chitinophaga qingshengii]|uniref:Probable RNA 2'-phosphotransferase n=1 Tax=Chitinophaga qingshengii TaxID=1569794 RepID=A0ABR7TUD0_9BACT|nr:RNA 2'-phosphotransferase [Chitinophaga qingshengii]MBC9933265.1 RNA 2'-phosphotransferase [Chitinophaga qingshengii]